MVFAQELQQSPSRLPGIGPGTLKALGKLGLDSLARLIDHFPRDYEDRSRQVSLEEALRQGIPACFRGRIAGQEWFGPPHRQTLKLLVEDNKGLMAALVCFNRPFWDKKFPPGTAVRVLGQFTQRYGEIQSGDFDLERESEARTSGNWDRILPNYPLTAGLHQKILRRALAALLKDYAFQLREEVPQAIRSTRGDLPLAQAYSQIHQPDSLQSLEQARSTLIFRELFLLQMVILRRALQLQTSRTGRALPLGLQQKLRQSLPFELTPDQESCLEEIHNDMGRDRPMARLLQGDVGAGKTLVAFLSALPVIEAGGQCALLAPTELLAFQHAENAARYLEALGIRVAFLSGNVKNQGRQQLLQALARGDVDLLVGTHALFSDDVVYHNLRYIIIDEQQRFGVGQRTRLFAKGDSPDMLLMSATPIPRTLAMTVFGDLSVSSLRTMPPGRQPIITHLARDDRQDKVWDFLRRELDQGRQAYVVYPLIEASEKMDLRDAQSAFERLSQDIFPGVPCGLLHSRVDDQEKSRIMEEFALGRLRILVATSVVEVGVDVANATVMVIQHAERFGLSALHQLRGRVGRSSLASYCFLVYSPQLSDEGKQRLKVMMETRDGFVIAEEDLKIRGPGELTGMRQSGFLRLSIADLARDQDLLLEARRAAREIVNSDPGLLEPEHQDLRERLTRFPPFTDELVSG